MIGIHKQVADMFSSEWTSLAILLYPISHDSVFSLHHNHCEGTVYTTCVYSSYFRNTLQTISVAEPPGAATFRVEPRAGA